MFKLNQGGNISSHIHCVKAKNIHFQATGLKRNLKNCMNKIKKGLNWDRNA